MSTICLILGILLLLAAIVFVFKPVVSGALVAYIGLLVLNFSGKLMFNTEALLFWGAATLIVIGLEYLLPREVRRSVRGRGYIAGGALVGMAVGMLLSINVGVIVGAAIGAALGGVAYSRTPAGRFVEFPSMKFVRYLCAIGLPAVVAFAMIGLAVSTGVIMYNVAN